MKKAIPKLAIIHPYPNLPEFFTLRYGEQKVGSGIMSNIRAQAEDISPTHFTLSTHITKAINQNGDHAICRNIGTNKIYKKGTSSHRNPLQKCEGTIAQ